MGRAKPEPAAAPRERRKPGPKPREVRLVVTSFRLEAAQWVWLRRRALELAEERGGKADASAVVRELIARAMAGRP